MAGPLQSKETQEKVKNCICRKKDCPYCFEKNCAGYENPTTNRMACLACFPHSPNFIHLREEAHA